MKFYDTVIESDYIVNSKVILFSAPLVMELKLKKASPEPNRTKVGTVTVDQVKEIAKEKMQDLNATDMESAVKIIAGSARSMGIEVE